MTQIKLLVVLICITLTSCTSDEINDNQTITKTNDNISNKKLVEYGYSNTKGDSSNNKINYNSNNKVESIYKDGEIEYQFIYENDLVIQIKEFDLFFGQITQAIYNIDYNSSNQIKQIWQPRFDNPNLPSLKRVFSYEEDKLIKIESFDEDPNSTTYTLRIHSFEYTGDNITKELIAPKAPSTSTKVDVKIHTYDSKINPYKNTPEMFLLNYIDYNYFSNTNNLTSYNSLFDTTTYDITYKYDSDNFPIETIRPWLTTNNTITETHIYYYYE